MLRVSGVAAGYGKLSALWDVSLDVGEGEFVALVGSNGAGKTTLLRTISGLLQPTRGEVWFKGQRIDGRPVQDITKLGISFITDDGCLFTGMTVLENIMLGAYTVTDREKRNELLQYVYQLFPVLLERKNQRVATLSGGERKMVAIARGLMSGAGLMLIDEPSLGLAPRVVMMVFTILRELSVRGVAILLVEQNVNTTLQMVDRGYVMEQGKIVLAGTSEELRENKELKRAYLGI